MPVGRSFVFSLAATLSLVVVGTTAAYHTRFVADNCNAAATSGRENGGAFPSSRGAASSVPLLEARLSLIRVMRHLRWR